MKYSQNCHWLVFETQKSQEKELGYFGPIVFPLSPRKILGEVTNKILFKHREVNKINIHQMDLSRAKSCQTNLIYFCEWLSDPVDKGKAADDIFSLSLGF